jgi:hypothetical protein
LAGIIITRLLVDGEAVVAKWIEVSVLVVLYKHPLRFCCQIRPNKHQNRLKHSDDRHVQGLMWLARWHQMPSAVQRCFAEEHGALRNNNPKSASALVAQNPMEKPAP